MHLIDAQSFKEERLFGLDGLRFLFAFLIMIYHLSQWLNIKDDVYISFFLNYYGIYAVEGFFVISGVALGYMYRAAELNFCCEAVSFLVKRYARILPLYIAACILFLIPFKSIPSVKIIYLNISMLFGFYGPQYAIPVAGWSLGVDFFFYFFLLFILFLKTNKRNQWLLFFLILSICFLFSYSLEVNYINKNIEEINAIYVSPFNHLAFFIFGLLIGISQAWKKYVVNKKLVAIWIVFFLMCPPVLFFYGQSSLIFGTTRIFFLFSTVCLVFGACFIKFGKKTNKIIGGLSNLSYSIYLMHPVVYFKVLKLLEKSGFYYSVNDKLLFSLTTTFFISWPIYHFYEKPAKNLLIKWIEKKGKIKLI